MENVTRLGDELVSTIYAAMLGETDWQAFLERLNGISDDAFSTFFHHDAHVGSGATTLVSGGYEDAQRDYERYYGALNPWMRKVAATPIGAGVVGEQVVARTDFRRTEYYNDFIRAMGFETGIGLTLHRDNGRYFLLSTLTRDDDADANVERAAVLTRIAPHLGRVFRYYREHRLDAFAANLGEAVADAAQVGMVLVDDRRAVVHASPAGARMLANGGAMALSPTGQVRLRDDAMQDALDALLASPFAASRMVVFPRAAGEVRLVRIRMDHAVEFFAGPRVAIVVTDRARLPQPALVDALASRCGLTPSERRVLEGIVNGQRVADIAERHGVSEGTVRTQLKAVFAKTQTHSQAELVRVSLGMGTH